MKKVQKINEKWAEQEIARLNLEVERLDGVVIDFKRDLNLISSQAASMSNDLADYASKMNSLAHYIIDQPTSNTEEAKAYANDVLDFISPRLESES